MEKDRAKRAVSTSGCPVPSTSASEYLIEAELLVPAHVASTLNLRGFPTRPYEEDPSMVICAIEGSLRPGELHSLISCPGVHAAPDEDDSDSEEARQDGMDVIDIDDVKEEGARKPTKRRRKSEDHPED